MSHIKEAIFAIESRLGAKDIELRRAFNNAITAAAAAGGKKKPMKRPLPSIRTKRIMDSAHSECIKLQNKSRRNMDCSQYNEFDYLKYTFKTEENIRKGLKAAIKSHRDEYKHVTGMLKEFDKHTPNGPSRNTKTLMKRALRECNKLQKWTGDNYDCVYGYMDYRQLLKEHGTEEKVKQKLQRDIDVIRKGMKEEMAFVKNNKKKKKKKVTGCVKQTTKKYTKRNSPPYPANQCCGKTKRGNDKTMYVSRGSRVCRWKKK